MDTILEYLPILKVRCPPALLYRLGTYGPRFSQVCCGSCRHFLGSLRRSFPVNKCTHPASAFLEVGKCFRILIIRVLRVRGIAGSYCLDFFVSACLFVVMSLGSRPIFFLGLHSLIGVGFAMRVLGGGDLDASKAKAFVTRTDL